MKELIRSKIRDIPDWPEKGVIFRDITPLLQDKRVFKIAIDYLIQPYLNKKIDKIVGIDARGFLLAAPMAYKLKTGVAIIRKKGKLPPKTVGQEYIKEYGPDTIEMHEDSILPGEKILLVDDVLATGSTMKAAIDLVKKLGGEIVSVDFLIELDYLEGRKKIENQNERYKIRSFINYQA